MFDISYSFRDIWKVAYPIIIGSVAQNIINVTDTAFLGRVGEVELGAAALGGIFYFAFVMLILGFGTGTQIIIARRVGEGNLPKVGPTLEHAMLILALLSVLAFLLIQYIAPGFLNYAIKSPDVWQATFDYLNVRSWGLFFVAVNILLRAFYIGIARTAVIGWVTLAMAGVNVVFNYNLIFGNMGFPEMGIRGAALASVISEGAAAVFFVLFTLFKMDIRAYDLFRFKLRSTNLLFRIFKVATPIMLQNFFSLAAWFVFFLLIEKLGEQSLAVSNIIRSLYIVLMIPVWGFSSATNTLVSNLIGSGKPHEVLHLIFKVLILCLIMVIVMISIGMLFPEFLLKVYTDDQSLIEASLPVFRLVAFAALFVATGFILFNGVSGTGKTQVSLSLEILSLLLYILAAYFVVFSWNGNVSQVWLTEYLYGSLMGLFSFLYLRSGNWKKTVNI